jgi:iron(III) transport system substrate-binding protein
MIRRWLAAALGCLLLAGCGGAPAASPSGSAASSKPSGGSAAAGDAQAKWDALVAAARKEGTLTLAVGAAGGATARQLLPPAFKEDFGIDLQVIVGPSTQLVSRLELERSSGQHTVDVAIGGADTMYHSFYGEKLIAPMKPLLIHPDVLNGDNWTSGKPWFMDPEQQYILRLSNGIAATPAVNSTMVNPAEFTSANDFLKPQYKGRMATIDPAINGAGAQHAVYLQVKLGADYVKKLYVDQAPVRTQDYRQMADWVARGNYPISIIMNVNDVEQAKKDGLPIKEIPPLKDMPGYVTAGSGLMAVLQDAPHPNAAQLFANWMALPRASAIYNRGLLTPSTLKTVKNDWAPDYSVPKPGVEYADLYDWDYTLNTYPKTFEALRKTLGS